MLALDTARLVNVTVDISPQAAARRGFGTLLIIGNSSVISTTERVRTYNSIEGVLADFANTTEEYKAALLYFSQSPRPTTLMIGRIQNPETPLQAVQACADKSSAWYGVTFALATPPTDAQYIAVADYIEASSVRRVLGIGTTSADVPNSAITSDIASVMKGKGNRRTFIVYSSTAAYAPASVFGRMLTTNFAANNSTITLMWKRLPTITAETLTATQADTLKTKRCNVLAAYNNDTAILQHGVMSGTVYIDEIHGLDWLQDAIQNNVWNLLYTRATKVPQTDAGQTDLIGSVTQALNDSVNNGLVAPGQWNGDPIGQLSTGDYLPTGYYVYSQPMAQQAQSDREQREAPPIQVAVKLAGAVHTVDVLVTVNR